MYYIERKEYGTENIDSGSSLSTGINCLQNTGVCQDKYWPYNILKYNIKPPKICYVNASKYKISNNITITNIKGYNYVIFDDDYIKVKEVFRYNNGGEFKDVVCSSCGWAWNKHDSEEHDVYVCHKCGTDNNPAHKVSDSLSSQEVEDKLGRKLDWWNDDIVYLSGIKYKKVYLRPEYKKVIE